MSLRAWLIVAAVLVVLLGIAFDVWREHRYWTRAFEFSRAMRGRWAGDPSRQPPSTRGHG